MRRFGPLRIFLIIGCLVLAEKVYSAVTISPIFEDEEVPAVVFTATKNFELRCSVAPDDDEELFDVHWKKNNQSIHEIPNLKGRYQIFNYGRVYVLGIRNANYDDVGNYSCGAHGRRGVLHETNLQVVSTLHIKVPSSVNAVEGEKLKIECFIYGHPKATVMWFYKNETINKTELIESDRVEIIENPDSKVHNNILIVKDVQHYDRGVYSCSGHNGFKQEAQSAATMVRIVNKYAAVWPFLGICLEVLILCCIITIYEKKRVKRHEDSDMDTPQDYGSRVPSTTGND